MNLSHVLRRTVALLLPAAVAFAAVPPVLAQASAASYPTRAVTLVVAFNAGGAADVVTRAAAQRLATELGQPVVVENKPGANGNIGANHVAKSQPDGYTLLVGFPGITTNPSLYTDMPYDPLKDLVPIKMLATAPVLLVANPKLPADSVKELIALAQSKPNELDYGSAGQGASGHMAGELFQMVAGVKMQHIPYRGGAPALNDLMGGQIDLIFDSVPSSRAMVEGKKLKALAIAGDERSAALPDVPTFKEAGLPDYYAGTWFGVLAPKGTPQEVVDRLVQAMERLVQDPEMEAAFDKMGLVTDKGTSADFAGFLADETEKWAKVVKTANIQLQ